AGASDRTTRLRPIRRTGLLQASLPPSGTESDPPGDARPPWTATWSVGMAPANSGHAGPDAASSDLRRGLFLGTAPRRSQEDGCECRQAQDAGDADVGVDRPPAGSPAGLYHVGTVPGQPAAVAPERPTDRFSRSAPHRQSTADEPAGLWGLWPAHVRQLSEQIDRLLWVYAAEERGIDVLRSRSRGGGRSRGTAGLACFGARHLGAQPESDPGRAQGARPPAPPLEAPPGAGHLMRRNVPNGNIGPSSPRVVSWRAAWSNIGSKRCGINAISQRNMIVFLKEQPPYLSDDQRARIRAPSSDLPTLWNAPETTAADRKEI